MCQQFTFSFRFLSFIVTLLISFGVAIAIVRIVSPPKYELFRVVPSEGGGLILFITALLFFILNTFILKCW